MMKKPNNRLNAKQGYDENAQTCVGLVKKLDDRVSACLLVFVLVKKDLSYNVKTAGNDISNTEACPHG